MFPFMYYNIYYYYYKVLLTLHKNSMLSKHPKNVTKIFKSPKS